MNRTTRIRLAPPPRRHPLAQATLCTFAAAAGLAQAAPIETENPDIKARWDTTVGYSLGVRLDKPAAKQTQGPGAINFNDGDINFARRRKPITNRIDVYTEADVTYHGFGARASAAAWYDAAYQGGTSNTSNLLAFPPPGPFNPNNTLNTGTPGQFSDATRDLHGQKAELLDAFVFGQVDVGGKPLNLRVGQHALLWGESLFFGFNAIASGMAPIDIVKAQSSPNATIKEIIRPVGQISGQLQVSSDVSLGAYYQYDWEKSRLPAAGSYFSTNDTIDDGGSRIYLGQQVATPGGPVTVFIPASRGTDGKAPNSGQGGVQARVRLTDADVDLGFYAIQYHSKMPVGYLNISPTPGVLPTYQLVYPEKIRALGASFNTTFGNINLGGEASVRSNVPLTRGLLATTGGPGPFDANNNPAYAVGRSAHINLSTLTAVPSYALARESNVAAEVAWNRVLSCTLNCVNTPTYTPRDSNAERDAWGFRVVYTPVYRQAYSGVDLSVPIGLSYSPKGKSGVTGPSFVDGGGDLSVGLSANVRERFTVALNFTHYYGSANVPNDATGSFTFDQALKDRDNVTLSARVSF